MAKRKRTDVVKLQLRIREGLRRQLEDAARVKDVSLNSEMVSRLEESFTRASMQDELNKTRAIVRDEVEKLKERLQEVTVREAVESTRERFSQRHRLEALEELEARLKVSLNRSDKLAAQLTAMLEARQSKGGKP
jgi:glutamyl-tRNA reductase